MPKQKKNFPNLELNTEGITIDAHVSYHIVCSSRSFILKRLILFMRRPVTRKRIKAPQPPLGVQNWWPGVILRSSLISHIGPLWSPTPCKENRSLFSPITIQPSSETPPTVGVQFSWSSTMLSLEVIEKSLWVTSSPTGSRTPSIIGRLDQEAAK